MLWHDVSHTQYMVTLYMHTLDIVISVSRSTINNSSHIIFKAVTRNSHHLMFGNTTSSAVRGL
jgi:hypothetical protein